MNKLPTEVIVGIASHLSLSNRLNLACVRKKLHRAVTENIFYSKLVFRSIVQFYQSMDLCKRKEFGHLVRDLRIKMEDHDSQFIVSLPAVFPRIKYLNWSDRTIIGPQAVAFNASFLCVMAKNWINNIETIIDYSKYLDVSTHLLETATCNQLTRIDVSFFNYLESNVIARNKTRALIANINNAPSLERITLGYTAIAIQDLEGLHGSAPNLKIVELASVCMSSKSARFNWLWCYKEY